MAKKSVSVTVNVGSGITVDPTTVSVHKNQDTIDWNGTSSEEFNIVFKGSGEPTVSCGLQGKKWVCTAGPFSNDTGSKRTVKYDVTSPGTPKLDPDVEVFP